MVADELVGFAGDAEDGEEFTLVEDVQPKALQTRFRDLEGKREQPV